MALEPPHYIPIQVIRNMSREYSWDDWDPYILLGDPDEDLMQRLSRLSDRAIIAFSIGCAEWVVYRFKELETDSIPYDFIEACWACEMDDTVVAPPELDHSQWEGSVRMPVDLALMTVVNTIYAIEDGEPEADGAFAERLPLHILSDSKHFLSWKNKVLERLESFFIRTEEEPWGIPVPRVILDPEVTLTTELLTQYTDDFISEIDFETNYFIRRFSSPT